jgi:hypothetical protein
MGREANCTCDWNGEAAAVKALLEPPDLILRGSIRRRIPFAKMKRVAANRDRLSFEFEGDRVQLLLGEAVAAKWARAILSPPPSLAKKLGIADGMKVRVFGEIDDGALQEALANAETVARGKAELILARVNTPAELNAAVNRAVPSVLEGAALWIVYRKGPGHAINESDVRGAGLLAGIVDVKVASVSPALTALKFVKRKNPNLRNT